MYGEQSGEQDYERERTGQGGGEVSAIIDDRLVQKVVEIAREVSTSIIAYYEDPALWRPQRKADASPVTAADLMAHSFLQMALGELLTDVPVLSEEGRIISFEERQTWHRYWLVDPLDGTQEFLNRSDEFSVNIALIESGEPVLGVLGLPVNDQVYVGVVGQGARCWDQGCERALPPLSAEVAEPILAVSRRRGGGNARQLAKAIGTDAPWCQLGGALKFCEMVEGRAHIYPRFSPVCEWDVAAGHALISSVGGEVFDTNGERLQYNVHEDLSDVYFCACMPGMAGQVIPEWQKLLSDLGHG